MSRVHSLCIQVFEEAMIIKDTVSDLESQNGLDMSGLCLNNAGWRRAAHVLSCLSGQFGKFPSTLQESILHKIRSQDDDSVGNSDHKIVTWLVLQTAPL